MASDESMNMLDVVSDHDHESYDDGSDHQPHAHNLSRLSVCTSSMYTNEDVDGDVDDDDDDDDDLGVGFSYYDGRDMRISMSRLSIESFDADEELSDVEKGGKIHTLDLSSDSDEEPDCYSLPATPPRRRNQRGFMNRRLMMGVKEYASENEAQKGVDIARRKMRKNLRSRTIVKERWADNKGRKKEELEGCAGTGNNNNNNNYNNYGFYCNSVSGESEGGGGGGGGSSGGMVVITRPKGGKRPLCMDLEEVKACRDLGFELEHERMLQMPARLSLSASTLDTTSSGGNSPIANWRISSPGDDPRDVKARLRVWAQAVALVSRSGI